jgi:hypothetical protein
MARTASVWGRLCSIEVDQVARHIWVTSGHYGGKVITVKDHTASSALKLWREVAASSHEP